MKIQIPFRFLLPLFSLFLVSFSNPYAIKRISDAYFRYEFYTTDKKVKLKDNKIYYWFKGGAIHSAQSGMAGVLLDAQFIKMYHSNQLAEQGTFKDGLKTGLWKTWHTNGLIQTTQNWKEGLPYGRYFRYSKNGMLAETGKYTQGIKTGRWIDFEKKDTLVYKKGIVVIQKPKLSRSETYKLKTEKRNLRTSEKALRKSEAIQDTERLTSYKNATKDKQKVQKESLKKEKAAKKEQKAAEIKPTTKAKIKTFFKKLYSPKDKSANE